MLQLLDAPDHVLAYRISGTLDAADYGRIVGTLDAKLAAHGRVGVYADMTDFESMTAEAVMKDLRYHLGHLGQWTRFPRAAVVTDEPWLRAWVRFIDPLVPQVEARAFLPGEQAEALAWVADLPAARS
ncbi:MAG: STAS/SEC14 domain-containing protein [Phenylobacterium sp.]|uniref:STAS/SEC14 domain-containing protein n=1 Tax=Phenylobacterium sp. TaxID=1871053 RepID=UPI001A4972F5|nr:STAS/SEC14 domain-containing protein [Phenylobacterium sp.]MBL8772881.1 STAS/SEC14 domain-containing protein [Phenylobacterium sp.]